MNYSINEVSKQFNITKNKIRFYEKKGLIEPNRNSQNDYRIYNDEDVLKLQSILMYRAIGMPIDHIKELMQDENHSTYMDRFNHLWQLTNGEFHRILSIRKSLENIMDKIYDAQEPVDTKEILESIKKEQEMYDVKSNWEDQWNFDNWAENYDKSIDKSKGKEGIYYAYDELLDAVTIEVCKGEKIGELILDIGIGTGNLAKRLLDKQFKVVGVDQSRNMLCVVKNKLPEIKVRLGDFMNLPFENNSFDHIATTYAFHHLNDEEKAIALKEMVRVIKPKGKIVIGDMMFRSLSQKEEIISEMTVAEIEEIHDEYYSNIEELDSLVKVEGYKLDAKQIDKVCWVVTIQT